MARIEELPAEILIAIFAEAVTSSSKIKIRSYHLKNFRFPPKGLYQASKLILPNDISRQESRVIPNLHLASRKFHEVLHQNNGNQLFHKQNIFEFDTANLNWFRFSLNYQGQQFMRSTEILRKIQNLEWVFNGGEQALGIMDEMLKQWTWVKHLKIIYKPQGHISRLSKDLAYKGKRNYPGQHYGCKKMKWESLEVVVFSRGAEVLLTQEQQAVIKKFTTYLKNSIVV